MFSHKTLLLCGSKMAKKNNIYHKNKTNKKLHWIISSVLFFVHTEGSLSTCYIAYNGLHNYVLVHCDICTIATSQNNLIMLIMCVSVFVF